MASKCDCLVLEALQGDPRLRTVPPVARMIWVELMLAMRRLGGVALRFGSAPATLAEIAMLVAAPESDVEAAIITLLDRGLLARESDGALASPLLQKAAARSETNRINGLRGGRPRRDAVDPRQRHMPLAIPGGQQGAPVKTDTEPSPLAGARAAANSTASSSARGQDVMRIGEQLVDIVGLDPVRWTGNFGIVGAWLAAGADEALIVDVVRSKTHSGVGSLKYFDKAMREAIAGYRQPAPRLTLAFDRAVEAWSMGGCHGPMPKLADFREVAA